MNRYTFSKLIALTLTATLLNGCGGFLATPTPDPTYTPLPTLIPYATLTSYPTYTSIPPTATPTITPTPKVGDTVVGPRWKVKVVKVETATEFGDYYLEATSNHRFVIVTLEYTYLGPGKAEFIPESVILVYTGSTGLTGWAQTTSLYRGEISSEVIDFDETARVYYLESKTSRTEAFVYEFNKDYADFRLYFPEIQPIAIKLM
jgi:hypothetical protein